MERAEQMPKPAPRSVQQKETPKYPTMGESARQVFYGVGKAVEWHMPHKWNERIIHCINKVLPKLSPDMQKTIVKHHKAIELGAKAAGITIYAAEVYAMYFLAGLGERKFRNIVNNRRLRSFLRHDTIAHLQTKYAKHFSSHPEGFIPIASALLIMIRRLRTSGKSEIGLKESRKNFRDRFEAAHIQAELDALRVPGKPIVVTDAMQHRAGESYARLERLGIPYREMVQMAGLGRKPRPVGVVPEINAQTLEAINVVAQADAASGGAIKHAVTIEATDETPSPVGSRRPGDKTLKQYRRSIINRGSNYQRNVDRRMRRRKR